MTSIHAKSKLVRLCHAVATSTFGSQHPRDVREFLRSFLQYPIRHVGDKAIRATTPIAFSNFFNVEQPVQVCIEPTDMDRMEFNTRLDEEILIGIAISQLKALNIFEIGTFNGQTTKRMAECAGPEANVYTLDLSPERLDALNIDWFKGCNIGEKFHHSAVASRIKQLYVGSTPFDFSPYFGKMDFVFVDAEHDYANVLSDTAAAMKIVRPGGVIFWHDFIPQWSGLVHAVRESTHGYPLVRITGTSFAAIRVPEEGFRTVK